MPSKQGRGTLRRCCLQPRTYFGFSQEGTTDFVTRYCEQQKISLRFSRLATDGLQYFWIQARLAVRKWRMTQSIVKGHNIVINQL